jgi:hypothetical protein
MDKNRVFTNLSRKCLMIADMADARSTPGVPKSIRKVIRKRGILRRVRQRLQLSDRSEVRRTAEVLTRVITTHDRLVIEPLIRLRDIFERMSTDPQNGRVQFSASAVRRPPAGPI